MSTNSKLQNINRVVHSNAAIPVASSASTTGCRREQQATDIYVACFEAALNEELKEHALSNSFRASFEKISSPYGFIRKEGLREALRQLCDLSLEAAEEARQADAALNTCNNSTVGSNPHLPFDAIRYSVLACGATDPQCAQSKTSSTSYRSESWERTQRALRGAHYTSSVFHRLLVPRVHERSRYNPVGQVSTELSESVALTWSTLNHAQKVATQSLPTDTEEERVSLGVKLTMVTYQEQEQALRVLQGLSLVVYDQRRVIAEGPLIPYAVEVWQCCLQHVEALFGRRRRLAMEKTGGNTTSKVAPVFEEGPVELAFGLETVVIASIDAVEAVCHYNPLALTRIVQLGGVRALLNLGLCPYAPYDIRCAVFDTISVLMQEVAPFRRAVTSGVRNTTVATSGGGGGDNGNGGGNSNNNGQGDSGGCNNDRLIQTMIHQAMTGGISRQNAPPPYLMDRSSASKFDSAVRDWFTQQGLSHVVSAVMELRDVRGTPIAVDTTPKAEIARITQRVNQLREKRLQALLQAVDGKLAAL